MTKGELKKVFLARRLTLTSQGAAQKSTQIAQELLSLHPYRRARVISLYSSIKGEVSTEEIFRKARAEGKIVVFPKVIGERLEFYCVDGLDNLRPGSFGILEPQETSSLYPLMAIDLLVVPGVAFDMYGNRLGYGRGYYDSILRQTPRPAAVALAFECQIYEGILPVEDGDAPVDMIVTEERLVSRILSKGVDPPNS